MRDADDASGQALSQFGVQYWLTKLWQISEPIAQDHDTSVQTTADRKLNLCYLVIDLVNI